MLTKNKCRKGEAQRVSASWHQEGHPTCKTLHQTPCQGATG